MEPVHTPIEGPVKKRGKLRIGKSVLHLLTLPTMVFGDRSLHLPELLFQPKAVARGYCLHIAFSEGAATGPTRRLVSDAGANGLRLSLDPYHAPSYTTPTSLSVSRLIRHLPARYLFYPGQRS